MTESPNRRTQVRKNDGESSAEGTMFLFLHKALTTINALAPKKFPKLKEVCEETIGMKQMRNQRF